MHAFDRAKVERFPTLPPGEAYPEGIDADADGNVYVVTVGANKPDTSPGSLFVFDPNGKLLRTVHAEGTSPDPSVTTAPPVGGGAETSG